MGKNMHKVDNQLLEKLKLIDEVIVRFNNNGHAPKPTQEMRLSTEKSNCKADYGCCYKLIK